MNPALREKCGIFGVYAPGEDVARLTFFGLHALQHRGQESAGIATTDGQSISMYGDMGLVSQIFDEEVLEWVREALHAEHLPWLTLAAPDVLLTREGDLMATLRLDGLNAMTTPDAGPPHRQPDSA